MTLIITPLKRELSHILEELKSKGFEIEQTNTGKQSVHFCPQLNSYFAVAGMGKSQLATQTTHLLLTLKNIQRVVCVGTAGSLASHIRVGDIIVADMIIEHDGLKSKFKTNLEIFKNIKDINVRIGPIASGDENIVSEQRAKDISTQTGALAVAWEGAGLARAANFIGVPFLEIRTISDFANANAINEFNNNLGTAMKSITNFLLRSSILVTR